jgi:GDP-4-dehydro-6-deoxy-D-mannose reductase
MADSVLVTGAAGFAGSHLLDALQPDASIVGWHRDGRAPAGPSRVTWESVDVLDRDAVRDALDRARPTHVYHCAGAAHVGGSWSDATNTLAVNVLGTHYLIEAVRDLRIDATILIPSSALVYAASDRALREDDPLVPGSPYGLSKLAQEMLGLPRGDRAGPPVYIARAFNHLGPRQNASFVASAFARQIADIEAGRTAPELKVGNLDARRDLTDVRDTVRAYLSIVGKGTPWTPYNVCSDRAITVRELLDMLLARARVTITVTTDPTRYRPNDVPLVLGDSTKLRRETGWHPNIPLDKTLDDLLDFWRSQP